MIVKIMSSARITSSGFPAVEYNEKKIKEGEAERVALMNFGYLQDSPEFSSASNLIHYLTCYSDGNNRVTKPQFHVVFSEKGTTATKEELMDFALKWLQKMGYAENPMVFYFHHDTANNHLHVVTSRINKEGKKINNSHERIRSQIAINEINEVNPLEVANKTIREAKAYSFRTVGQFRAIVESSGYETYESDDQLCVKKGGVVLTKLPLATIQSLFDTENDERRKKRAAQIKAWFAKYKEMCNNQQELKEMMKKKFGIDLIFHGKGVGGKEFKPYGYTIVDHHSKMVLKGSEVMPVKQVLEFLPVNRAERQNQVEQIVDTIIQNHTFITTKGLNDLLKTQVNAYVKKGKLIINKRENDLKPNVIDVLKRNDKLAWVNSFNPKNDSERKALATLFKVDLAYVSLDSTNTEMDESIKNELERIAHLSNSATFKDNLRTSGFILYYCDGEHFILSLDMKVILNTSDLDIDNSLFYRDFGGNENDSDRQNDISSDLNNILPTISPSNVTDNFLDAIDELLSDNQSHGVRVGKTGDMKHKKTRLH